ncbi:hypothetical protein Caci_0910 [Catenulispora acidiphila DSM 44928]|uniref:Uncharacterized protein n=1 Tax=Catenulispora acidiphila (strain DSM 44928 / JCM 14897 / NBRC 102108 / NRRL B-24433 / ID139908) TaxID=479433 RepID=C7Q2K0_CATAD|nr:hypothetical protein Caci_0910 [Catenulispora acidiphila DSM 44928]
MEPIAAPPDSASGQTLPVATPATSMYGKNVLATLNEV